MHADHRLVDVSFILIYIYIYVEIRFFFNNTESITMAAITENDKYVLNAMFNPNYPLDFDKETPLDSTDAENQSTKFV